MSSHSDRRSALLLLALTLAGLGVRYAVRDRGAPGGVLYRPSGGARPIAPRDSLAARALRLARPLRSGERLDLDQAPVEELARLPRVGPGLAARIAAERDAHGPFGSLEALGRRVPGAGAALLAAIRAYADFTGTGSEPGSPGPAITLQPGERFITGAGPDDAAAAPRVAVGKIRRPGPMGRVVSLNAAPAEELATLPGIGPRLAQAIVADRAAHGAFQRLEDLTRVRGVGPALVRRLAGRLRVP